MCKPELTEELKNTRSAIASPEPWIDQVGCFLLHLTGYNVLELSHGKIEQLLQISHVMPGYFPKGGGWPAIAKTTAGVIRGAVHKQLDRYISHINEAICVQLSAMQFVNEGGSRHPCLNAWPSWSYNFDS